MLFQRFTVLTLVFASFHMQGCGRDPEANTELPAYLHQAETVAVVMQDGYAVERRFAGRVQARQESTLGFELSGRVASLLVNEGDQVISGQVLARMDTQLLEAEQKQLDARKVEIQSQLDLAQRNLDRIESLQRDQLASERDRDERASEVQRLEATLAQNEAARISNRIRQDKSILRAPYAARIGPRLVDAGTVVSAGSPVFRLLDAGQREVRAGLPVALTDELAPGVSLRVQRDEDISTGQLLAIGAEVDQATRTRAVRIAIDRPWPPGEVAYLLLDEFHAQSGTWLPETAVTEGLRGTWVVYVARAAGDATAVLETRTVTVHHARPGELFVSGALQPGDQVITGGLHRLAPGQQVRTRTREMLGHVRAEA